MKIGIITNPLSERNKRREDLSDGWGKDDPDVLNEILSAMSDMRPVLEDFAAREVGVVVLDGGDGTIQMALSEILNRGMFERLPYLAVIPTGMTNAVAGDVGLDGPRGKALARLAEAARRGALDDRVVERHTMRVSCAADGSSIYGMLFATGAIYRAIRLCRRAVHPLGLKSTAAVGLTLAGVLGRRLLFRQREDEIFCGDPIAFDWNNGEAQTGDHLFVLASTLHRLPLGIRPFWGEGPNGLRITSVAFPPHRFARSVWPLLYGGTHRNLDSDDYVSRNVEHVSLRMTSPFVLDGEIFEPVPGVPVTLSAGRRVRFVR